MTSIHVQEELDFEIEEEEEHFEETPSKNDISDPVERQIREYQNSKLFAKKLEGVDWEVDDREELLREVQRKTSAFSVDYLTAVELILKNTLEKAMVQKSPRFEGIAHNLISDEQIQALLEQIRIKRFGAVGGFVNLPPELQLVLTSLTVIYKTYLLNGDDRRSRREMLGPRKKVVEEEEDDGGVEEEE